MMGDAIQEIYLSNNTGWNQDYVDFVSWGCPFLIRGGYCSNGDRAGLLGSYGVDGGLSENDDLTFRVVLVP